LPTEQRQQLLQQMQLACCTIGRLPRRWALRAPAQTQTIAETFADFLRQSDRQDLNLSSIQRFVQRLLQTTQGGLEQIREFLSHWDRAALVALLIQRSDLDPDEIESIATQIQTSFQQIVEQMQSRQQQVQHTIATRLQQFRAYLTQLELPGWDDDRLKQELSQLLADPQAGLETLKERWSNFNQDALATLLSARQDISASLAHQITDRIASLRGQVLQQVEQLQQQTKQRLEDLQQQTQQRAEITRRAVAIAVWWLFGTVFTSGITAAIAGALAVKGLPWLNSLLW
jgi:ElaB/YqjD/DUF883 family membrane-anchored ribosome-binding protein